MVAAGVRVLLAEPHRVLERGLRSEDVMNAADASAATFYRKFPTKSDFLVAVLDELTTEADWPADEIQAVMSGEANTARTLIRTLIGERYGALSSREAVTRHVLAHGFADANAKTVRARRGSYRRVDDLILEIFEAFSDQFGATLRKPFTVNTFAASVTALIEGFALRSRIDATAVSPELLTEAVLSMIGTAVTTSGKHEHVDDVLTSLLRTPSPGPVPRDIRAAIVGAARDEFGKRGYFSASLDEIAHSAGVPHSTARRLFPTKPHILVAALRGRVLALGEAVADDVLVQLDETTIVENHLLRCAQLVGEETVFMDSLLVAVAHETFSDPEGLLSLKENLDFPAIVAPVIQLGQDNGVFATFDTPTELAAGLTNTLLHRCFTRRNNTPEENAAFVSNLYLRGLVDRRA